MRGQICPRCADQARIQVIGDDILHWARFGGSVLVSAGDGRFLVGRAPP